MRYKTGLPKPSRGLQIKTKKLVVPDQSMSLQEILQRFTRNEALPIGHDTTFDEAGDEDISRLKHMDLVDKAEYVNKLHETKKRYEKQEAAKERAKREKIAAEERAKIREEELQKLAKAGATGATAD